MGVFLINLRNILKNHTQILLVFFMLENKIPVVLLYIACLSFSKKNTDI